MKIGYARVSTIDRTPARQLDALKLAGCTRIFEETTSGARGERPQLKAALSHLRKGDTLVVWKLDRLAYSLGQLIRTINGLDRRGIGFIALTDQIDTTTAQGRLTFHLIGALVEFERAIISERAKTSMKAAKARGAKTGRPTTMTIDKIKMAKKLAQRDLTPTVIARRIGLSVSTLYRYLPGMLTRAALAQKRKR
jgi:DNA invertase Pin-like site-specific DNA recombinase